MKSPYLYNHRLLGQKKCPEMSFEQFYYNPFIVTKALKYEPNVERAMIMKKSNNSNVNQYVWMVCR